MVQAYRLDQTWLLFTMPLLIFSILWDRWKPEDVLSSRSEITALRHRNLNSRPVSWWAGIQQIIMTLFAHLVGASVGREAVGIQLGGWAGRLRGTRGWYFGGCLAAGFAIVLGTPIAAALFVFESKRWHSGWREFVGIPLLSYLAYRFSTLVGVTHVEYRTFDVTFTELRSIPLASLFAVLTSLVLAAAGLSVLFLWSVDRAARRKKNVVGQILIPLIFLTLVGLTFGYFGARVESTGLPGLGVAVLPNLWLAEPDFFTVFNHPLLFGVLKVFLTAAFVGLGVRGGELTPLLFAGALIAVGLAALFHLPIASFVALGFPVLWGIAARRPLTAAILAVELFGFSPWGLLALLIFTLVFAGIKICDFSLKGFPHLARVFARGLYDESYVQPGSD